MLTVATPSPPVSPAAHFASESARAPSQRGLPGVDGSARACGPEGSAGLPTRYWPCELLNAFVLHMAAQGHCVNMSMMLGHHPYALERLSVALVAPDPALRQLALQLNRYFDAPLGR